MNIDLSIGIAKRDGSVRGPLVKNVGRIDLFNSLTRISSSRISPQPARVSNGTGRAGPLTRKKKKFGI